MAISTGEKIFLCITLTSLGGIFAFIGVALHMSYTKMDLMLGYLKNCPVVVTHAFLIHAGPKWRLHVLGVIMALMVMPKIFLRDGGASAEDLNNFPADLRRKLIILHWTGCVSIMMMCCVVALDELGLF